MTQARISGHAIEARLYAEDVAGRLPARHRDAAPVRIPAGPGMRVDAGYATGSVIGPHYDAMLAKVIAHGRTRADAARRLARALAGARLHGVTTNRALLAGIYEPEFLAGRTDTGYLTRHDPAALSAPPSAGVTARHAAAAALARQEANRAAAPVLASLPSGWRNVPSAPQRIGYAARGKDYAVSYRLPGTGTELSVNGEPLAARIVLYRCTPDTVDLEADGIRRVYAVHRVTTGGRSTVYVDGPDGSSALAELRGSPTPARQATAARCWRRCPGRCSGCSPSPAPRSRPGSRLSCWRR